MTVRALLIAAALALPAAPALAAPFTMVCTSGGDMKLRSKSPKRGDRQFTELFFRKATRGSNASAPPAGHCAWTHRKLNAREKSPARLVQRGVQTTVEVRAGRSTVKFSARGLDRLRSYVSKPNKRFSMEVAFKKYATGKDALWIKKVF